MKTQLFACLFALFCATCLNAAIMNNGDFMSDDYIFMMVTENSDPEPDLHYGAIDTSGNTLLVDPVSFGVQAQNGPATEMLASTLSMMIVPKNAGGSVDTLVFFEEGDFSTNGDGMVDVSLPYTWEIVEVDGNPVSPAISVSGNGTYTPLANGLWSGAFDIDFDGSLSAIEKERSTEYGDRITKVNFSFTNKLTAEIGDDPTNLAFIKKKNVLGGIAVTVPEPSGIMLGIWISGVLMLFTRRR